MNIKINGKEYKVKYTIRALFIYEQITGKPFHIATLFDNYLFFYCLILANNKDNVLDWDEFIEAVDTDKKLYEQLTKVISDYQKQDELIAGEDDASDPQKKN